MLTPCVFAAVVPYYRVVLNLISVGRSPGSVMIVPR